MWKALDGGAVVEVEVVWLDENGKERDTQLFPNMLLLRILQQYE